MVSAVGRRARTWPCGSTQVSRRSAGLRLVLLWNDLLSTLMRSSTPVAPERRASSAISPRVGRQDDERSEVASIDGVDASSQRHRVLEGCEERRVAARRREQLPQAKDASPQRFGRREGFVERPTRRRPGQHRRSRTPSRRDGVECRLWNSPALVVTGAMASRALCAALEHEPAYPAETIHCLMQEADADEAEAASNVRGRDRQAAEAKDGPMRSHCRPPGPTAWGRDRGSS